MAGSDDWRVTITVSGETGAGQVFLYAGTEAAARDAGRVACDVLAGLGMAAGSAVHRWHPLEEQWEDPGVPMPQTKAEREAEHQRLVDAETAESQAAGTAQWDVRVELGSHRQAVALARELESEGRAVVRRWKFRLVGVSNEDEARELAGQIRQQAPPGTAVLVEQAGAGWPFIPS